MPEEANHFGSSCPSFSSYSSSPPIAISALQSAPSPQANLSIQTRRLSLKMVASHWVSSDQPRQQCEVYGFCGAFGSCNQRGLPFCQCLQGFQPHISRDWDDLSDTSGGCVRKTSLQCGGKDGFLLVSNMKLPEMKVSLTIGGAEECESACSNNCSCQAWSFQNGCLIWYGQLLNLQQLSDGDSEGRDLYVRLAVSELENILGDKKGFNTWIIVGAVSGIVVSFGLVLLLLCRWWKRRSVPSTNMVGGSTTTKVLFYSFS